MYENLNRNDLTQLFMNTVVRYNKEPVFIHGITEDNLLNTRKVVDGKLFKVLSPTDKKFDFTPVSLGLVNQGLSTFLFERIPMRAYRVGLSRENSKLKAVHRDWDEGDMRKLETLQAYGLYDCILNKYPTVKEALDQMAESKIHSRAIDRVFSIDRNHIICHRGVSVGMVNSENGQPIFHPPKSYLKLLWREE